jgi:hypothetical protein
MMYHQKGNHYLSYEHLFECYHHYKVFEEEKSKLILVYIIRAVKNAKGSLPAKSEEICGGDNTDTIEIKYF